MSVRLIALNGSPDILLIDDPIIIGRHPTCDVRLPSMRVSRRHCCMALINTEVSVRDLGSTNGTRINGRKVEAGRLRHGDLLSIGNLRFRLDIGGTDNTIRASAAQVPRVDSKTPTELPGTTNYYEYPR